MHICPDEIMAVGGLWASVKLCCAWFGHKASHLRWWR